MKNGIGSVAGWPWLPGIGLDAVGVAEPPARAAVGDQVAGLRAQPQVGRPVAESTPSVASAICSHRRPVRPRGPRRAGPVEEVGAAVVGDLDVAGEQRVGLERRCRLIS